MARRTRPHHLLVRQFATVATEDGFLTRNVLVDALLHSKYASTAVDKIAGYVNDIFVYDDGQLEARTAPGSRKIIAWRLINLADFDPDTGFNRTVNSDESPRRRGAKRIAEKRKLKTQAK